MLNAHGYRTEGYPSAEAFLDRHVPSEIGCLVLDIHLAAMTGIQLRHRLSESGSAVPVIFITAVDDKSLERQAVQAGCVACLHKPFAGNLLISAVEAALAGSPGL